jgi:hypothetical protein
MVAKIGSSLAKWVRVKPKELVVPKLSTKSLKDRSQKASVGDGDGTQPFLFWFIKADALRQTDLKVLPKLQDLQDEAKTPPVTMPDGSKCPWLEKLPMQPIEARTCQFSRCRSIGRTDAEQASVLSLLPCFAGIHGHLHRHHARSVS